MHHTALLSSHGSRGASELALAGGVHRDGALASSTNGGGGQRSWKLAELCRRRLLEGMVRQALNPGGVVAGEPLNGGRAYLVLVADALALRTIEAVCRVSDLLEERVCLVETIDAQRQAVPSLDALYFLAPTAANVEQLLKDIQQKGPMYSGFHVFFSHKLNDLLLQSLAQSPEVVARMRSFQELNLSFFVYDDRSFHLGDQTALPIVLEEIPPESDYLAETACRLATVLTTIDTQPSRIFYAAQSAGSRNKAREGKSVGLCERIAHEVRARLSEIESKRSGFRSAADDNCAVLILDRSIDWTAMLAHDMHYEALLHDVLGSNNAVDVGGPAAVQAGRYTYTNESGDETTANLNDAKDPFWEQYRHKPIWEVLDLVVSDISAWKKKDEELRGGRTASSGSGANAAVTEMVSGTLAAMGSVPEHKARFRRLELHSDLCHRAEQAVQANKLVDVAEFEQDLATGVDKGGGAVSLKELEKGLMTHLRDHQLDVSVKTRLLLLFLSSAEGMDIPESRRKDLARFLDLEDRQLPLSQHWAEAQRRERPELTAKRKQRFRERARGSGNDRNDRLRRWEPRLRELIEELASRGALDEKEFPALERILPTSSLGKPTAANAPMHGQARIGTVVIFVVGGVTMPEIRVAHEAARDRGIEVFVGGSCLLTPSALRETLRDL